MVVASVPCQLGLSFAFEFAVNALQLGGVGLVDDLVAFQVGVSRGFEVTAGKRAGEPMEHLMAVCEASLGVSVVAAKGPEGLAADFAMGRFEVRPPFV